MVKSSKMSVRSRLIPEYLFADSGCLDSNETFEIEIEALRNSKALIHLGCTTSVEAYFLNVPE